MPPEADAGDSPADPTGPETPVGSSPEAPLVESTPELTLDEFVSDAVHAGAPVELANAFHAEERAKPPRKAARGAWADDFDAFAGRPA